MNVIRFSDLCASGQVAGKRVFIRADLNVPQDDTGAITEDTRIRASIPCIEMALKAGAAVMVTSHLGRPTEGEFKPKDSLAPVAVRMGELMGRNVPVVANWVDGVVVAPGQLVLLENCRVLAEPETPTGGHRGWLQGLNQAHHFEEPGRQCRPAHRRWWHCQHVHAGSGSENRQESG